MPYKKREHKALHAKGFRRLQHAVAARIILPAKDRPCMDCGGRFPPCCMDFDHRDQSTKIDRISRQGRFPGGMTALRAEIAKCDVVCANCHRIRTVERGDWRYRREPRVEDANESPQLQIAVCLPSEWR